MKAYLRPTTWSSPKVRGEREAPRLQRGEPARSPIMKWLAPSSYLNLRRQPTEDPGSQWLARKLQAIGHSVRIIPAQFVKPYVKSNKNVSLAFSLSSPLQAPGLGQLEPTVLGFPVVEARFANPVLAADRPSSSRPRAPSGSQ